MEFMLDLKTKPFEQQISYKDSIFLLGSCFTEQIGNRLDALKFRIAQNPNGIVYDPFSVGRHIRNYINKITVRKEDLVKLNGLWHSWEHHSRFSGPDVNAVVDQINQSYNKANQVLNHADWLIITLGSAFYYHQQGENRDVTNCHKFPASTFNKRLATTDEILQQLGGSVQILRTINPAIKIIFTVSPVRHIRDGIVENNLSKSRLIDATHQLVSSFEKAYYFPAYELVMDVLRDYRFFERDMVHPNSQAADFVFDAFINAAIHDESKQAMKEVADWCRFSNHRPFNSDAAGKLQQQSEEMANRLREKYPFIKLL